MYKLSSAQVKRQKRYIFESVKTSVGVMRKGLKLSSKLEKIKFLFFTAAALLVLFAGVKAIVGVTPQPGNTTWSQESGGYNVTGGYIYNVTLDVSEQTYRWAAFWGNLTGKIVLKDSSGNDFVAVHWTINNVQPGSIIYATPNQNPVDPTNLAKVNQTFLNLADQAFGYDPTVTDSITNTYKYFGNFQSPSRDTSIPTNMTWLNVTGGGTWKNYILRFDSTWPSGTHPGDEIYFVFAVEVLENQKAFNSQLADYELLIPENEEAGDGEGVPTTYYFWVELK